MKRNTSMGKALGYFILVITTFVLVLALMGCTGNNSPSTSMQNSSSAAQEDAINDSSDEVEEVIEEEIVIPDSVEPKTGLSEYTWPELKSIANMMTAAGSEDAAVAIATQYGLCGENGRLRDMGSKPVTLTDGTEATVRLIGVMHDDAVEGGKAAMTFMFEQGISSQQWYFSDIAYETWESSDLRKWMNNDGMNLMPKELNEMIVKVKKNNNKGNQTQDKLWCPAFVELGGELSQKDIVDLAGSKQSAGITRANFESFNDEGSQYKLFKEWSVSINDGNYTVLKLTYNGSSCAWHERTCWYANDGKVVNVSEKGHPFASGFASSSYPVVPFFCI